MSCKNRKLTAYKIVIIIHSIKSNSKLPSFTKKKTANGNYKKKPINNLTTIPFVDMFISSKLVVFTIYFYLKYKPVIISKKLFEKSKNLNERSGTDLLYTKHFLHPSPKGAGCSAIRFPNDTLR